MIALRYVYVVLLALWLGGMVALGGLAAPATFAVLQQEHPDTGRTLAGQVFGETLKRFHVASYVVAGLLLASLLGMAALGSCRLHGGRSMMRSAAPPPRPLAVSI